jgi:hypothetical protein
MGTFTPLEIGMVSLALREDFWKVGGVETKNIS